MLAWLVFITIVITLLSLDLGVFNRKDHVIGVRESLFFSAGYIAIGLLFGAWVWYTMGAQSGKEYLTGYVIEKTLSLDNIFVISLIFSFLKIPRIYQHRVLFWGIIGVIILRGLLIGVGGALVHEFEWVLYVFAGFLVLTGIRMLFIVNEDPNMAQNPILKFLQKHLRLSKELNGNHFTVKQLHTNGSQITYFTPLFLALVLVEISDLIFAVDSVPAIFAITTDTYIVYTSNLFAVLGLRALYFALDNVIERFKYVKYALSIVLIFIGGKVFAPLLFNIKKVPTSLSMSITIGIIAAGILYSIYKTRKKS